MKLNKDPPRNLKLHTGVCGTGMERYKQMSNVFDFEYQQNHMAFCLCLNIELFAKK